MLTIAGCGGGGGSNVRPNIVTPVVVAPPPPPPVPVELDPSTFRTQEFNTGHSLGAIGAEFAYAKGFTGEGVIIGILDFNFDFSSSEVDYAVGSIGINQNFLDIYETQIGEESLKDPHGHAVAVFAAGTRNLIDTHGVAFDAKVLAVDFFAGVNVQQVQEGNTTVHVANPYVYMTDRGAQVINISIGFDDDDIIANPPQVSEAYVLDSAAHTIDQGAILVASAGNAGDPEPSLSNLLILDDAANAGLLNNDAGAFIIVGSVDQNNIISDFSDRAGRAQDIYLVAPGEQVVFPFADENGPGLFIGNGTSFSAPLVSGAAAILFQQWPQLSGQAVANILFDTATDLGDPGTDTIYGRGLLNLQSAVEPLGTVNTTISGANGSTPLSQVGIVLSQAFGDARPLGLSRVMGLDAYGRDFYYDLRNQVIDRSNLELNLLDVMGSTRNTGAMSHYFGSTQASLYVAESRTSPVASESRNEYLQDKNHHTKAVALSLQGSSLDLKWQLGTGLSMAPALNGRGEQHDVPRALSIHQPAYLATAGTFAVARYELSNNTQFAFGVDQDLTKGVRYHPNPMLSKDLPRYAGAVQLNHSFQNVDLGFRLGVMIEKNAVLGSRGTGGFGIAENTTTGFLGLNGRYKFSPTLSIEGRIASGMTVVEGSKDASYFNGFNNFISTSWSAQLLGRDLGVNNSVWILGVAQPLRVENATLTTTEATHIDVVNALPVFEKNQFTFTPSGREIAVEAAWRYEQDRWMIQASLLNRFDPGHVAGRTDTAGVIWFNSRF